jgi:hypothetical protein
VEGDPEMTGLGLAVIVTCGAALGAALAPRT